MQNTDADTIAHRIFCTFTSRRAIKVYDIRNIHIVKSDEFTKILFTKWYIYYISEKQKRLNKDE